jgi:hypothetical protein
MTSCRLDGRWEEEAMRNLFRAIQSLLLACLLLVGAAGATLADEEAAESQETPAVEASPPEPASEAGQEDAPEEEQSAEAESGEE